MKITSLIIPTLTAGLIAAGVGIAHAEEKSDIGKKKDTPGKAASQGMVANALKGKLVKVADDKVADYELTGAPEYYVLYHSASW